MIHGIIIFSCDLVQVYDLEEGTRRSHVVDAENFVLGSRRSDSDNDLAAGKEQKKHPLFVLVRGVLMLRTMVVFCFLWNTRREIKHLAMMQIRGINVLETQIMFEKKSIVFVVVRVIIAIVIIFM